jgi:uncharacterized protein (UPF0332 family)
VSTHKSKLDWCLKKEIRMKRIPPSVSHSMKHIQKAKHNIMAMNYNVAGGFSDWAISQGYYAMYHALIAILFRFGYESRNHECTINTVEYLIQNKNIELDLKSIMFIRTASQKTNKDAKKLREQFQYGAQTRVNHHIIRDFVKQTKKVVEEIETSLYKT